MLMVQDVTLMVLVQLILPLDVTLFGEITCCLKLLMVCYLNTMQGHFPFLSLSL